MRFAAFIITFHRPAVLRETVGRLLSQSCPPELILVVDNSASTETAQVVSSFGRNNLLYHPMPENLGPAGGVAYALTWFMTKPYDWIYWGDDNNPPHFVGDFERLLRLAAQAEPSVAAVGAVGGRFDWKRGQMIRLPDEALTGIIDVDAVGGGSQLILRRDVVVKVGVPNPCLFFGYEEGEFCLRLRRAGYRLLVDGDLMLQYRIKAGRLQLKRPRSLAPRHEMDNVWRQYYSTRNAIYIMRRTFARPDLARWEAFKALGRSAFSWLRGPRYGATFTQLQLRGIIDGYLERMGRTVTPRPK